ncbi:MAG: S8/S53 family peptidase [Nisaea sp.]|uniref:S8/S53 family peptidase n=1 Tax=Nisaea sp. TaxID=2024842 RepID=UPI001B0F4075|nr:S8/S53 family peptidase [Nisaea sp.]MBO6560934.1 S8/S53 family peptidase [Nisaea sp.]
MGVWSVGIIDSGVTNETEARLGRNLYEYDYYYRNGETDGGRRTSHGSTVAESVERTNAALERIDLQVTSNSGYSVSIPAIQNALGKLASLNDAGWHIGAYNMSFGSPYASWASSFQSQINALANRGIYGVASAGNSGSATGLENPTYPAGLSNVISVGSHDGAGNPSNFSQNSPATVHVLADGEGFPGSTDFGTSFAAPQVAATVTTVQALVEGVTDHRLSFGQVIDVLQLGGAGPQSAADPANGVTTYFLHTHTGSVDYALATYVDPNFSGLEYIASYSDLEAAFSRDAGAARAHFLNAGVYEGRTVEFDGLEYVASHPDLIGSIGTNREVAAAHYLDTGRREGRLTNFDADNYMKANPDLAAAFGGDDDLATRHYITSGYFEGRSTGDLDGPSIGAPQISWGISEGTTDLPFARNTHGYVGVGQSVTGTVAVPVGGQYDLDLFRTDLVAGQTVVIHARGGHSGGGNLHDPYVAIYDSDGFFLANDRNSGVGLDAALTYTPTESGTHYIMVTGGLNHFGTYTVDVLRVHNAMLASATDEPAAFELSAVEPAPEPESDDIQLKAVGPEPVYTDWVY